jgi:hypothetical protein
LKKFAAIILLCLYTFNLFGYLLLFHVMEQHAEQRMQTSLDKEAYLEEDLITLKVPLSLPYVSDTQGFERIDGQITIDGKIYHYVKRAIKEGALVLMCLPDHQKMKIERAKQDFFKLAGDLQPTTPTKKTNDGKADIFKGLRAKYTQQFESWECFSLPVTFPVTGTPYNFSLPNRQGDLPDQPPEWS